MFNLVDDPWIPVECGDGSLAELSLREVFSEAPRLRGLAVDFVPERVAVTRMLVAVLGSACRGPSSTGERTRWIEAHADVAPIVAGYLDRWRPCFELFDPERPFMQRIVSAESRRLSVSVLRLDWSSGNNATLFDHHVDDRADALTPAEAARALLTTLLYQPGGGVSTPFNRTDSPGTKPLLVLVLGASLWETLAGNAPRIDRRDRDDAPTWEREDDHTPDKGGTVPLGWLDRATWCSRAIQLVPDGDGLVRACRLHQHLKIADGPPFDPFAPRYVREGQAPNVVRMRPDRRLWRSADAILSGLASEHGTVISEGVEAFERLDPPRRPRVLVSGLQVVQAKIADAQSAVLPVSSELLEDERRLHFVAKMLEQAELGARAIRKGVARYRELLGAAPDAAAARRWEELYWPVLATPFSEKLAQIADEAQETHPDSATARDWIDQVRRAATRSFDTLSSEATADGRHPEALAQGRAAFRRALGRLNNTTPTEAA